MKEINVFTVLNGIENKASKVFYLFSKNDLKANSDKSNLLLTSKEETSLKTEGCIIKCNTCKKLLGDISKLCKNANQNLHALSCTIFSLHFHK